MAQSAASFSQARLNMVDSQIKPFSVTDRRVLTAFLDTPREAFIPSAQRGMAYLGEELPMGQGRFLLDPASHARLLQDAGIQPDHHVLEIGCLTGYSTAILARLAKHVTAVDEQSWIDQATRMAPSNVSFATTGNISAQAFDVIIINGAVQMIPAHIAAQLKEGGRIATFIRNARGDGHAALFHKHKNGLHLQILFDAFIPVLPGFAQEEAFVF